MTIHPDDSREAFGVLALHFGKATDDTREAVMLYRRLEDSWDKAMQALAAAQERRERLGWDAELDRMHAYDYARRVLAEVK